MPRKSQENTELNFDKVWLMFQETARRFQETDVKFKETDERLSKKFAETDKKIKKLAGLFTTQWGKLVEALVEPSCLKLFKDRGIQIEQSFQNVKAKHGRKDMECDILLVNTTELVVVEVKTTYRPDYTPEFLEKLAEFKKFFPQYKDYKVLGAVAALKYEGQSDKHAYRQGLFVLRCTGDGVVRIANDKKFAPKAF